jgi:hypothetical protein
MQVIKSSYGSDVIHPIQSVAPVTRLLAVVVPVPVVPTPVPVGDVDDVDDDDDDSEEVPRRNHKVDDTGRMVTVRRTRWKRRVFIVRFLGR